LLIAFFAIIIWYYTQSQWVSDICYNVVVMAGISTVLFNANPLLRFDGYYLLSDVLGIVNLYGKGQAWFGDRLRHLMFGFPLDQDICSKSELRLVATYGLCSFAWRIILSASLLLVASTLLGGAGLVLAAIGGVFWIWMPLTQNIKKVQMAAQSHPINRTRMAFVTAAFSGLVLFCFVGWQAPAVTRAPAIIQFRDEQIIRAAADGFVREINVNDCQAVKQGQLLVRLENPELVHELRVLTQSFESAKIQSRIHSQRDEISLQQSQLAKIGSIQQQIDEMETKVSQLNILAPFDGVVYRRDLANMLGSFVRQGDVIMHFADPQSKQILTSIDQEQIKSVRSRQELPVRFDFAGLKIITANWHSIEPRASDIPIDPAMTAAAGGVLPVRHAGAEEESGEEQESNYRLIHPRFTGKSDLNPQLSTQLVAGQRGTAFLSGRNVSLGGYFLLKCKVWIRQKLLTATQTGY